VSAAAMVQPQEVTSEAKQQQVTIGAMERLGLHCIEQSGGFVFRKSATGVVAEVALANDLLLNVLGASTQQILDAGYARSLEGKISSLRRSGSNNLSIGVAVSDPVEAVTSFQRAAAELVLLAVNSKQPEGNTAANSSEEFEAPALPVP